MKEAKEKGVRQCSLVGRERENETKEAERQKSGASKERQISDTKQKPLMDDYARATLGLLNTIKLVGSSDLRIIKKGG